MCVYQHQIVVTLIESQNNHIFGIWRDESFTFKYHTENLITTLVFLYRSRSSFPSDCREGLVEVIFLSLLQAAATALDSSHQPTVRFTTGDPHNTHHCLLYIKVGGTSLAQRWDKNVLFFYKALAGLLPSYISSILDWTASILDWDHQGHSDYHLTLQLPLVPSELAKSVFVHQPHGTIFKSYR